MLKEGDWVEAITLSAHAVIGYIEKVEPEIRQVLVRVIRCCCAEVRELEWASMKDVSKLPETNVSDTEGYLLNAIDFALDNNDRDEFLLRTQQLRLLRGLRVKPFQKIYVIGFTK